MDREREYLHYLQLLCQRVPARVFNTVYGLALRPQSKFETGVTLCHGTAAAPGEPHCTAQELLEEFARVFRITQGAVGRRVVKDLFCGKLRWIALPPTLRR